MTGEAVAVNAFDGTDGLVYDFSGNPSFPGDQIIATASPIMVHARLRDDSGDSSPINDLLEIIFDEDLNIYDAGSNTSIADLNDFDLYGPD
jgi:hypothetical protein